MTAPNSKRFPARALSALAILGLLIGAWFWYNRSPNKPDVPDETAAGLKLLSREFAAPGYFHLDASVTNQPPHDKHADYYIDTTDARKQISRVLAERNLSTNRIAELETMIDRLAEPPESRTVGSVKVNVLRLNLALDDALKK